MLMASNVTDRTKPKPATASGKPNRISVSSKSAERRRHLARAAYQALAEKGFEGLRMREIARRAGINHATLHYYFAGKEQLIDSVVDHIVQDLSIGRNPRVEDAALEPRQRLKAHFNALVQQMRDSPEMFTVLAEIHARSMRDRPIRSIFVKNDRNWTKFLTGILQAGVQKKEFDANLVPEVAAEAIISLVRGLTVTCAGRAELMQRPLDQLLTWIEGRAS